MESIWTKTCRIPKREPLQRDKNTEVAVIGAGMAGILIAYQLQKAGKEVILLEANRIASGQTRNTTAKITSQHDLKYAALIRRSASASSRAGHAVKKRGMTRKMRSAPIRRTISRNCARCASVSQDAFIKGTEILY